jgi:hypothetical protein
MTPGLIWKSLAAATLASAIVWLLTVATFDPDAWVDNRPYCSNMVTLPDGPSGVGLPHKTFAPGCRFGPLPPEALGPSPVPAVASFLLVGSMSLVIGIRRKW